jgi:enoyl-CoA hydratase
LINWDLSGEVALITLDRHERRNALDAEHCDALAEVVGKAVGSGARSLVITGAGTSFCAGADLEGVYGASFRRSLYGTLYAITAAPIPVIAAVNGPAVGAGTQLAIASDLRVAAPGAWFAVPVARHGLAVDPWTIRRLALLAGGGAARALLLGGGRLDAELAVQRGLVDRIGGLDDALAWAGEIASFAPESLAYSKRALETLQEPQPWDPALDEAYEAVWRNRGQG